MLQNAGLLGQKLYYDEIVLNDAHLGHASAKPAVVREILLHTESQLLVIAGDFFDLWELAKKPEWRLTDIERDCLALLAQKTRHGTRIVFIPGNHEDVLRRASILERNIFGVEITERLQVRDEQGAVLREYTHGDEFDGVNAWAGRLVHSIGYYTGGAYLYHPFQRLYNKLQPGIRTTLERYSDQWPMLKPIFPTTAEKISRETERYGVIRQNTPTAHRVHRGALRQAMENGVREKFFGHAHAPVHLSAQTRDGQSVSIIDTGDVFENTTLAVRLNGETRLIDWGRERAKIELMHTPSTEAVTIDPRDRGVADRQERLLHRLVPGSGRGRALRSIYAHLEKAEERRARAALFREAAHVMTASLPIKKELQALLKNEFGRFSEKIRDIECQISEEREGSKYRRRLEKKLLWHRSVHRAIGAALSDRLVYRVWMPCEKIKDIFDSKAQRFDLRACESIEKAQAIRNRLAGHGTPGNAPNSAPALDIAA